MAPVEHAIAPGGITCQVTEEISGNKRYVLRVPVAAVPIARACIDDLMTGRYRMDVSVEQDTVTAGVAALLRLLDRERRHRYTGQARRIVALLAGLYNGSDYPFDLTELRAVDRDIAGDCLAVLRLDSLGHHEVQRYVENGDALWRQLIEDYGLGSNAGCSSPCA